ncbi:MAG TPA: HupE/UreJ family protein [Hyphomicrobiaceae bacterium]|nr:HupE/UreJ family protein [Hyphomicrobiaceae bacterium]
MTKHFLRAATPLVLITLLSDPANAHTGLETGFSLVDGILHPLSGFDHVAAMVCVGLWAALAGGRAQWMLPASFFGAMVAGAVMARLGVVPPSIETGIAVSVIGLGLAVAAGEKVPMSLAALVVAIFGLFHGAAHGAEAPSGSFTGYAVGFALTTMVLHASGFAIARLIERFTSQEPVRAIGALAAASGLVLVLR